VNDAPSKVQVFPSTVCVDSKRQLRVTDSPRSTSVGREISKFGSYADAKEAAANKTEMEPLIVVVDG